MCIKYTCILYYSKVRLMKNKLKLYRCIKLQVWSFGLQKGMAPMSKRSLALVGWHKRLSIEFLLQLLDEQYIETAVPASFIVIWHKREKQLWERNADFIIKWHLWKLLIWQAGNSSHSRHGFSVKEHLNIRTVNRRTARICWDYYCYWA